MSTDLEAKRLAVLQSMKKAKPLTEIAVKPPPPPSSLPPPLPPPPSGPKPSSGTSLVNAVLDLTNLGYEFWQIVEKSGVRPEVLTKAYEELGYPVPPAPIQPSTAPSSEPTVSAPAPEPQSKTKSPSPPISAKPTSPPTSALSSKVHRFGEDRSHSVSITLSDDDDSESDSGSDNFFENDTTTRKNTQSTTKRNTTKANSTDRQKLAETLEAQRAKIRQVAAQLKLLQDQKGNESAVNTPAPESATITNNISANSNGVHSNVDANVSSLASSSGIKSVPPTPIVNATPIPSEIATSVPSEVATRMSSEGAADIPKHVSANDINLTAALSISMDRMKSLSGSLENFKREQAKLNSQTKLYTKQLENNRVETTKRQIEELKRELERKMAELLDRTYKFASAQASLSAIELQKKRIQEGISRVMNDLKLAREELEHLRVDTPVPESQPTGALTNGTTSNAPATIKNVVSLARSSGESQDGDSDIEILDVSNHISSLSPESKKRKGSELIKTEKRQVLDQPSQQILSVKAPESVTIPQTIKDEPRTDSKQFKFPPKYFTPYESPLKPFKSFRFSPFYKESVSGGYKSLTYSNTITQKKNIVCSNEIFKGKCTNKKCPYLHFAQMKPTDYTILGEMNRAFIGETPEEVAIYKKKLHDRILELGHSSDFSTVADAAIDFRRNYNATSKDRILDWNKFESIKEKAFKKRSEPAPVESNALINELTS